MTGRDPTAVVEARGLTKSFGDDGVLDAVDLRIEEGEITVIMGPNGAGKSVLLCCLGGGLVPAAGTVRTLDRADRRAATTLLLQGSLALPELTARQNVAFYARLDPNATAEWEAHAERFEVDAHLDDKPLRDFSGGMRRKVELAIALSVDVPVYLLDEPTAGLDLGAVGALHDLVLRKRARGKTFVVTSHAPIDVRIADRVAFLRDGRVVADDTPDQLLEAVPPVARLRRATPDAVARLAECVVGGRTFQRGGEARGFLRSGVDPDEATAAAHDALAAVESPSYRDLFDFYAHLAPGDASD